MSAIHTARKRHAVEIWLAAAVGGLLLLGIGSDSPSSVKETSSLDVWLEPHDWRRDSDTPALALGEKGTFDDQHIFAPHVIAQDGEFWMYYSGSQRCVDAGTYKGKAKDPAHPERSDQRLFKLGLAKSKDGRHFTRHSALGFAVSRDGLSWTKHPGNPVFRPEPAHDWESNFTTSQTLMRLPDGNFRLWYAGRKQPPWSNLYFAIGTAQWKGPEK